MKVTKKIKARLEYLRGELNAERISMGELAELQGLVEYIAPDDVQLLEAAGVPEGLLGRVNLATVFRLYSIVRGMASFSAADVDANEIMYEQARSEAKEIIAEVEG